MKCEDELSTNRMLVILVMPVNVANDLRLSRGTKSSVDVMMDDVVNQVIKKRKIIDRVIMITTHKRMSPDASAFVIFHIYQFRNKCTLVVFKNI